MSSRNAVPWLLCAVAFSLAGEGRAEHLRLHGGLGAARALGGWQGRELSFGGLGAVAAELPVGAAVGVTLGVDTLLLASGEAPRDPGLRPTDGAHAIVGAFGLRARPFEAEERDLRGPLAGIWAGASVGGTTTGGLLRPAFGLRAGYDFFFRSGAVGVGPELSYLQVLQGEGGLRGDDARVLSAGVHGVFDTAEPRPRDRDGDGIRDRDDRCPLAPEDPDGFEDRDGCPDPDDDADRVPDLRDHCPREPEDRDGVEDEDGCPDEDDDRDGVPDPRDGCPKVAEDADGFDDHDGCPDEDDDADGVPDRTDLCPREPETRNDYADDDGCPDEDQVRVVGERIVLDDRVHFEMNNAIIREVSFGLLGKLAKILREHPEYVHVEVQGHADARGDEEFNRKLSQARAESVVEFLGKQGIQLGRLSARGFGASRLISDQQSERAHYLNRRVEFVITRRPPAAAGNGGGR